MKSKINLIVLAIVCLIKTGYSQSPQKLTYQAVIRNTGGALVTNSAVGMKVSFLQGSASGSVLYSEVYSPPPFTNANGLVTVEIGNGTPVVGTFSSINWANGPIFIKVESDPTGGISYSITGIHQLLSVPYALYSSQAEALANGSFINPSQIAQDGALTNQVLKWNGTKWTPANDNINDGDTL
ncbi:MAG: collagen-like protein, partial [Bacteroidia bacterium]|nr:collagen-like protein [Bacteroidia bacterium]